MQAAGDPHDHYIPEMGWADFGHVLIQHMNRLQNRNEFLLADAATGASRTLFVDEDRAWVEANHDVSWINQGREFLALSERDGWRHLYRVARDSNAASRRDRKSTRLNSSHEWISYAVFCLKKKKKEKGFTWRPATHRRSRACSAHSCTS